ncbi:MAG: helix-turn-helix domain-containing protein [Opitutales bacterium]|nr:helix-turn-helix domain-containing protein [Opitutales bacterium]
MSRLSPDLQNVCRLLSESRNVSEIARILKRSRTTIHKQIKEIRDALKDFR